MNHWYIKSEPNCWSWRDQCAAGKKGTGWDGVRNHLAKKNLQAMKKGDTALFYESVGPKVFCGVVVVTRTAYPDATSFDPKEDHFDPKSTPENPRWWQVDVVATKSFIRPVPLSALKADPLLSTMLFVRQGRLSVGPVGTKEFKKICAMGGVGV